MAECLRCDDFHWVPRDIAPGWYARDWRLLLDPTVEWEPCPDCQARRSPVRALEHTVSRMLVKKLRQEPAGWTGHEVWQRGLLADGQVVWRQGDVYCLPPGPLLDAAHWTMISDMGILRDLDRARCDFHLQRAHLHPLPGDD